jgi:hypothetical protein
MSLSLTIDLNRIENGIPGLTTAIGKSLSEAAAHCLELKNHRSGVVLDLTGDFDHTLDVTWKNRIDEQTIRAWADIPELTEHAAVCVAILVLIELTDYTVIRRAVKGTGIDYWLGYKNALFLQDAARLEVSGIFDGTPKAIGRRATEKKAQTNRTDGSFPVYIAVVEFSRPMAHLERK